MLPETPTRAAGVFDFAADLTLVETSFTDRTAQEHLLARLRCVPRMLAAKNAQHGRALDDVELEDLAQETILTIWRKRAEYTGRSSIETWIYPFCYHHLMNRLRGRARRPRTLPLEAANSVPTRSEDDFGFVYRALAEVGPPDEDVLRLKHFEQLTFDEIGRVLGIPPSTAKTRYYHGLERLRTLLAAHGRETRGGEASEA
jgi:RNA polymerase sigma factor (sigma-70 family)